MNATSPIQAHPGNGAEIIDRDYQSSKLNSFLFSVSFFMISLQSFYFYGSAIFCYIGLLLLVPFARSYPRNRDIYCSAALWLGIYISSFFNEIDQYKSIAGQIISISALIIIPSVFSGRMKSALFSLRITIIIHTMFATVQVLYFAIRGDYLDYLQMLGVADQVVMSKKGIEYGLVRIPRFSGLFNEPGTYSTIMCSLLAIYFHLNRKVDFLLIFSGILTLTSVSLGGMVVIIPLAMSIVFYQIFYIRKYVGLTILASSIVLSVMGYWVVSNYILRVDMFGTNSDHEIFIAWITEDDLFSIFGNDARTFPYFYTNGYLGTGLDIFLYNGIWGTAVTALYIASSGLIPILLSVVVLASKIKLTYPLLYVLLALVSIKTRTAGEWR